VGSRPLLLQFRRIQHLLPVFQFIIFCVHPLHCHCQRRLVHRVQFLQAFFETVFLTPLSSFSCHLHFVVSVSHQQVVVWVATSGESKSQPMFWCPHCRSFPYIRRFLSCGLVAVHLTVFSRTVIDFAFSSSTFQCEFHFTGVSRPS
jgi:hypothetical protein